MTILAGVIDHARGVAARIGLDPEKITVPMQPCDGAFHFVARGDRFDQFASALGVDTLIAERLSGDDVAYAVIFDAALTHNLTEELRTRGPGYSRWNWMGPHLMMMRAAGALWGEKCEAHYRQVLERTPLTDAEIDAIRPGLLSPKQATGPRPRRV